MPTLPGRPARTLEELGENFARLRGSGADMPPLIPRPDDVFITSWAKSGTTLMQQMFHQIRMLGSGHAIDMDFDDISRMTPWEDTANYTGCDMNQPQRAAPRGFKSHREYERLPPDARYVVTLRDPKETYVSFHRFFEGWHLEPGAIDLTGFFPIWMLGGPGGTDYFTHLLSWYARRDRPDTLLASYRAVTRDRAAMIRRLARFIGVTLSEEQIGQVEAATSREFMHAHKDRFDDAMVCQAMEERLGIPADSDSSKVQAVASNAGVLPEAVARQIDAIWAERVLPVTGHADFASLAAEVDARAAA